MFCFQCQKTAKNSACTLKGVCGKPEQSANLQDLLIYVCKGIGVYGTTDREAARFVTRALFTTIINAAWDDEVLIERIREGLRVRGEVRRRAGILAKASAEEVRITAAANEDVRSLRELLIIGCKGIAAYAEHAEVLGHEQEGIDGFLLEALASTTRELSVEEMVALVLKAGETAVKTMALLDKANTAAYGNPKITEVNLGVRANPGILISGHDLKDLEELLEQTRGTGNDVYTGLLPADRARPRLPAA